MANVVLYIATSLDGFIARKDGSVDWLFTNDDYGYSDFWNSIDCLMMGRKTFEQVLTFGAWPYSEKMCYVCTSQHLGTKQRDISFVNAEPAEIVAQINASRKNKIWLVGGAELTAAFSRDGLIDEYILSIHPILLGDGTTLFMPTNSEEQLKLLSVKHYSNGLVQVHYKKKV